MLFDYLKKFKAWKVPDENKLVHRIKHALIALYQAEDHLPPDEPKDSTLSIEFRTQITRLRGKLQQIAGPGELRAFDEQRMSGWVSGIGTVSIGCNGDNDGNGGGDSGGSAGSNAYSAINLPRMTNEQLAHELLLDPGFQLNEEGGASSENPVRRKIRESFHKAFWDSLVDDLRMNPPCYVRVIRVFVEIRDGIAELNGSKEKDCINEIINVEFVKERTSVCAYSWDDCKSLVISTVGVIKRMQCPDRDMETAARWNTIKADIDAATVENAPVTFCKGLEFLLDRLNVMRIDIANARCLLYVFYRDMYYVDPFLCYTMCVDLC